MRLFILATLITLAGCESLTPNDIIDAVQLGPDECGTAQIKGNMEVGGTLGFFGTTVVVDIDKEKQTFLDPAGNVQVCQ